MAKKRSEIQKDYRDNQRERLAVQDREKLVLYPKKKHTQIIKDCASKLEKEL